jgi:peptidoglycan/xylan/chitin deacetylase (PgdA/CDA1 family)
LNCQRIRKKLPVAGSVGGVRKKDIMRRVKWKWTIWMWGLVALLLSVELYPALAGGGDTTVKQADSSVMIQKEIALTFDDGPHPVYTPKLLDGLKERGVKASFFLIGESIEGNEEIIRRMYEEGHLIGNHSQNHMQLTKENVEAACQQIERTNQKIYEITGEMPSYIRPPYGSWSEELECMVPMTVVLWNIDTLDWKSQNTSQIVRHVRKNVEDGSIILLHDVYGTSVAAALEIIDTLSKEGYNFVTVDELIID